MEILGVGQWVIWIIGVVVFGGLILWLALASFRQSRGAPELPSAAVQVALAELDERKAKGTISEAAYQQARAKLLAG